MKLENKFRRFKSVFVDGTWKHQLETWIIRRCRLCGKFINKHGVGFICSSCSTTIWRTINTSILRYGMITLRGLVLPYRIPQPMERKLWSYLRVGRKGDII